MPGVRKNFAYNFLLTVSGYIFPLITYPYISRVLGVDNIGVCNFVDSVINYFVLFSQLGISSYGVREVARCKDDPERLKEVFSNLFFLNLITFVVSAIVLVVCTFTVPKFLAYKPFLLVGLFKLLFTLILVDWFFQGIEQFRFITIRTIVVKFLYVIGVFVFIRDSGDALIYYMLTTGMVVLNAILNWHWSKRFTKLSFKRLHPLPFIVPILVFGYYRILTSMYTTFNVVFLGFVKNDVEVGYFSQATKLYSLIMATFSAFTTVMVPRVSAMIGEGRQKELQGIVDRIVQLLVSLAVPAIVYCVANAESIVHLVSGPGYEGAELPFRIVVFLLLVIGLEQVVIQQCLMASKDTKPTMYVATVGAVVGILLNVAITPRLGAVGSSISWGVSELAVLIAGLVLVKKTLGLRIDFRAFLRSLAFGLCYLVPVWTAWWLIPDIWWRLGVTTVLIVPIFLLVNLRLNPSTLLDEMKVALNRFIR